MTAENEFLTGRCGTVRITPESASAIGVLHRAPGRRPLRLLYASGTDHILGSYAAWERGEVDPSAPAVSYSTQLLDVADALGAELAMVCPGEADLDLEPYGSITVARFDKGEGAGGIAGHFRRLSRITRHVRDQAVRFEADAVIFSLSPFWPSLTSFPCPLVVSFHNNPWRPDREKPGLRSAAKLALARAPLGSSLMSTVAVSEAGARQVETLSGGRQKPLVSVTQAKDDAHLPGARQARSDDILFVGRIEGNKGVFDLLHAALLLKPQIPSLRLRFLGSGAAEERLKHDVTEAAAGSWVTVEGWCDGADIGEAMSTAACLVCPTRSTFLEGLPRVIHEAHLAGCPVIASSVATSRAKESTLVYPADDCAALTAAIRRLVTDPALREELELGALRGREVYKDRTQAWGSRVAEALAQLGAR